MRDLISSLIIKQRIKDPRVNTLITITDVVVSSDLTNAKVYVSSFENEHKQKTAVEALNHAAGFIQKNISQKIKMRVTPKLTFYSDECPHGYTHEDEVLLCDRQRHQYCLAVLAVRRYRDAVLSGSCRISRAHVPSHAKHSHTACSAVFVRRIPAFFVQPEKRH